MILAFLAGCAGGVGDDTGAPDPGDTAPVDTLGGAFARIDGAPVDGLGNAVLADDLDGDGHGDLLVAAYLGNRVCRVRGPLAPGAHAIDAVGACLAGERDTDYAGYGIATLGDLDGDGVPDVAVGSIGNGEAGANAGKVYLLPGTWSADVDTLAGAATATLLGEHAGDYAGLALAAGGDLTGDGAPDLLVGAPGFNNGLDGGGGGRVYVVAGPVAPGALADSWATLTGLGSVAAAPAPPASSGAGAPPPHGAFGVGDFLGDALTGPADYDGDGAVDLALGAGGDATLGPSTGKVLIWFGPLAPGAGSVLDADVTLTGPAAGGYAGSPLQSLPDLDGDGRAELLVAGDGLGAGVVWVLSPGTAGTFALADAPIRIEGRDDGDLFGAAVSAVGDLDGDDLPDLLVGAPGGGLPGAETGAETGAAHVLLGMLVPGVHTLDPATWHGAADGDDYGRAVTLGDLDGDSVPDPVVGAPGSDGGGGFSGGVWVLAE